MVDSGLHQSHGRQRLPESSVETIDELIGIFLKVAMRHAMADSCDKAIWVADRDVRQTQPFVDFFRRCDSRPVIVRLAQRRH